MLTAFLWIAFLTQQESESAQAMIKVLVAAIGMAGAYAAFELRQRKVISDIVRVELQPTHREVDQIKDRQKLGFNKLGIEFDDDQDE